jgi:serine/threonine-protein kinase HipA
MIAIIQININGEWIDAATYDQTYLEYDPDFIIGRGDSPLHRVGMLYPVNFEMYSPHAWPAFLFDILPSGAGRRVWLRRMGISERSDGQENNWALLLKGSGNPPGNIRILQAAIAAPETPHAGFTIDEIVEKNADFIEYAEAMGAVVTGATDIPGDAPKFMLVRDHSGRWHPDGGLPDSLVAASYILKFPRGKDRRDYLILRNEAQYYEVARRFGVRCAASLQFRNDSLLIPRFDRTTLDGKLLRHGLETVCSVADIAGLGKRGDHPEFCRAIAGVATDPQVEIFEYLRRDILNTALRNVDNHGRNTAFLKRAGSKIELSPLYDFAPMFLDPAGIARASKWPDGVEAAVGRPDWSKVTGLLAELVDPVATRRFLAQHAQTVRELPGIMKACGVEAEVINGVANRCDEIGSDLALLAKD